MALIKDINENVRLGGNRMPRINQEEYEVLKALDDRWKWIARDKDGTLVMGAGKNERYSDGWFPPVNIGDSIVVDETNAVKDVSEYGNLFQFIQWEDEPYKIAELIEEYENSPEYVTYISNERTRILSNDLWSKLESEETDVKKDIKWLKDEILTDMRYLEGNREIRHLDIKYQTLREVAQKIHSLDEPEVLSQKWIDDNKKDSGVHYIGYYVPIGRLQNLLVPKQELPVIPNYVAKWISEHHERFDLYPALRRLEEGSTRDYPTYKWYRENTLDFVVAYLTGEYEIEQEPKYYAKIKGHENIGSNDKYWNYNTDMEELSVGDNEVHPNVISEYTIKATKEEWANLGINDDNADFVKVEELE